MFLIFFYFSDKQDEHKTLSHYWENISATSNQRIENFD